MGWLRDRQQIVICIIAGAMVCGFLFFRYLPQRKRSKSIKARLISAEMAVAKATAESQQLPLLAGELIKIKQEVGDFERQIPDSRDVGQFLHEIADLMSEHNLKDQQVNPDKEIKTDALNCMPVSMKCKGKLARIFEFYRSLQQLDRLVRIEQVELVNDKNFTGEVSMQTQAVIYYRPKAGGPVRTQNEMK